MRPTRRAIRHYKQGGVSHRARPDAEQTARSTLGVIYGLLRPLDTPKASCQLASSLHRTNAVDNPLPGTPLTPLSVYPVRPTPHKDSLPIGITLKVGGVWAIDVL